MDNGIINVEVVYALPEEQTLFSVQAPAEATTRDVIIQSGVLDLHPELDLNTMDIGIFGKLTSLKQKVRDRDRIEIYRPLIADPKEVRKKRAAEGKRLKKGGSSTDAKARAVD
jgi:putative ubiquitin-RnfH superfamily antitoxin RatB of RatAB toxin-antitoxin module